ncbi:dTMP kinase [Nonomuraea sp. NPDC050691]|uniref:dTMP kinase n=1 Tax=Nonomuraea sp. NPDC050691 TaxID=3155661 RepID=UPI0033D37259
MLIAFCGIDGAGKSTQIARLARSLEPEREVRITRQPSSEYRNSALVRAFVDDRISAEQAPAALREMAVHAAADRLRHVRTEILPHLARGAVVISDRYVYSTYAYFLARGLDDLQWLIELNRHVPEPDLTFYLDISPETAGARVRARDGGSHKREEVNAGRMTRAREVFLTRPWGAGDSYHVIDGTLPEDEVARRISAHVL